MMLDAGPVAPVSFTDDTSLPHAGSKVSIHAQIIPERSLDWFYFLRRRAPDDMGEVKSPIIVEVSYNLPEEHRRTVLATLKAVRIHITDPRPYTRSVDEALSDILRDNVADFIKRLDRAQQQYLENERRKLIVGRMLKDAPAQQIRLKYLMREIRSGTRILRTDEGPFFDAELLPYDEVEPPKEFDFTPFEGGKKNVATVLSPYLSKSKSVFCETMDSLEEVIERGPQSPMLVSHQLCALLSASHAFDQGNAPEVEWIDGERRDLMTRIDRHGLFRAQPGPLTQLDSKDSFLIQAADFAGGIASEIWRRNSLPHLTSTFDYVTYNGKRISETQAVAIETP